MYQLDVGIAQAIDNESMPKESTKSHAKEQSGRRCEVRARAIRTHPSHMHHLELLLTTVGVTRAAA